MSEQESRVCLHGSLRRSCEPCDLADRLEAAEATIALLRTALLAVEWDDDGICLWCGAWDEHEADCLRQRALTATSLEL